MKVPILKLRGILLTSIQVDMEDEDALAFQDDLLRMLAETEAKGAVIDITAMDVVDSFLARVLNETASMVRTLGGVAARNVIHQPPEIGAVRSGHELVAPLQESLEDRVMPSFLSRQKTMVFGVELLLAITAVAPALEARLVKVEAVYIVVLADLAYN